MAFTKILPAGISTTGLVTVDSLSVGDVTLTGDTDNLIINTDTVTVRPTLDLNFARDKRLDSKITFTRDSVGTYVDANGLIQTAVNNIPRFDHDPITGESLGLLIEESRTNYETYSSSIHTAYTASSGAGTIIRTASTATTAPDGTSTTDALIEDTSTNTQHTIIDAVIDTFTQSTAVWTHSVFVKLISGSRLFVSRIYGTGNDDVYVEYNLSTGISSNGTSGNNQVSSHGMDEYPNGWWRCWVTFTAPGDAEGWLLGLANGANVELPSYDGDGTSGFYIWGAQLEAGSFPTSYIPTSGSTVTRAADLAKITGTNFSDWYNQTEGTIFFNYKNLSTDISTIRGVWGLENSVVPVSGIRSPNSGSIRIRLFYNNNFSSASSNLFLIDTNYKKGVVAYNQTENRLMMDGTSDFVSATHTNDTIVALSIGSRTINGDSPLGGHIKSFKYYPKRLSNAQLQNLTK